MTRTKEECVLIDFELNEKKTAMECLYGGKSETIAILGHDEPEKTIRYVKLTLNPMQFVILKQHHEKLPDNNRLALCRSNSFGPANFQRTRRTHSSLGQHGHCFGGREPRIEDETDDEKRRRSSFASR